MNYKSYRIVDRSVVQRRKINLLLLAFMCVFIAVLVKLVNIQIVDSEKYKLAARKQYENKVVFKPFRGLIFDRNMNVLVSNTYSLSFAADPNMVTDPEKAAAIFAKAFGKNPDEYLSKLSAPNTSFVFLEKGIPADDAKGLDSIDMPGIIVLKEPKRVYNYGSLASQILGFTNSENKGQYGIELSHDAPLSGKEGYVIMQRDGKGNNRPSPEFPRKDSENGRNIVLTIDINLQRFAEEELAEGVSSHNADGGKVVIMSVKTGEILAMCSNPTFDPNNIRESDTLGMKNAVISDIYEPGSTFKIISAAASLEERLESKNSIIQTESINEIKGIGITDVHSSKSMTFSQAVEQSSNVGFGKIALKIGDERFYKYARDFGFGISSGIELPGENKGFLKRPIDFSGFSLPYMAIGYEVLVNTMQISNCYAAVANKGLMMRPFIVKKEMSPSGEVVFENMPGQLRQVISENTSASLIELLTGVIENGTGRDAKIEGVKIAGKTGTAQRLVNGKYSSNSHNSSFVGFFPAEDPQLLITVVLNNPKSGEYYGGKVAAPVFRNIAERIIGFTGTDNTGLGQLVNAGFSHHTESANVPAGEVKKIMPNLINLKSETAKEILMESGISYEIEGAEADSKSSDLMIVVSQVPQPNEEFKVSSEAKATILLRKVDQNYDGLLVVPDVKGMSVRKGMNLIMAGGFGIEIDGSGKIIEQSPLPGTKQLPGTKILIYCGGAE